MGKENEIASCLPLVLLLSWCTFRAELRPPTTGVAESFLRSLPVMSNRHCIASNSTAKPMNKRPYIVVYLWLGNDTFDGQVDHDRRYYKKNFAKILNAAGQTISN